MIRRTAYQRQLPLADLHLIALPELRTNPTITSYLMVDGREIRLNMLDRIQAAIDTTFEILCSLLGVDWDAIKDFTDWAERQLGEVSQ